jgi:hypothetical protein
VCRVIPLLLLASCASTGGKDVSTDKADARASGVRFYEKAPFILVTPDGKGGLTSKYVILPDYTRKRSISPYSILATNDTELNFLNGMLNNTKSSPDTTKVPSAIVETAKEVALTAVKLGGLLDSAEAADRGKILYPPPALYRLVLLNDKKTYVLRGGYGLKPGSNSERQDILVTVLQPKK